jgi:outer membrane protein OmpA-like peptidoglycan-associated protein
METYPNPYMKNCTVLLIVTCFLSLSLPVFSQVSKELAPGYYVVVGAYAKARENMAQNYVEILKLRGFKASYGFNSSRNLYFVYLSYFTDLKTSLRDMSATRKKGEFKDAWVRVVPGAIVAKSEPQPVVHEEPKVAAGPATEPKKDQPLTNADTTSPTPNDTISVTDNPEIKQYAKMTLGNTEVFLSLYNGRNNRIVEGDVTVIDTERSKQMTRVKGNEYLILPDPKSKSGQLTLICEAFGYRKVQEEINYPLPLADTVKPHIDLMGTTIVINFNMVRYHKGDIAVLYNVYFFNDAAIMSPESKFELNSLLEMMQENPNYKIRLHGHTNGNYHGKIIKLGPEKNFFSLEGSTSGIGSAKDLSFNRADVIKQYLVANGVAADRIEIKAWGGKRPLYDKHSANAKKNVRVEVEILEE